MAKGTIGGVGLITMLGVIVSLMIGWVLNIVHVFGYIGGTTDQNAEVAIRIVGIFLAPLGGVIGWL